MPSNYQSRLESLCNALKVKPKTSEETTRLAEVYREALEKNFREVRKDREIKEWTRRPFLLDFSIEKKKVKQTRGEKLKELLADLDFDDYGRSELTAEVTGSENNLNEFENDYDRLEFSRRHANYGATGKSVPELKRFINAKSHEANLKQLSVERFAQLKKLDTEKNGFMRKQIARGFYFPPLNGSFSSMSLSSSSNIESVNPQLEMVRKSTLGRMSTLETPKTPKITEKVRFRFENDESPTLKLENEESTDNIRLNRSSVRFSRTSILLKPPNYKKAKVSGDPRFINLSRQLMSAYFVDKNKDINDIINNNTALRAVNEFNRKKEEDLKKKRALMKYLKDALNSTDYFIKA